MRGCLALLRLFGLLAILGRHHLLDDLLRFLGNRFGRLFYGASHLLVGDLLAMGLLYRFDFFADFFLVVFLEDFFLVFFLADFFAAFLAALFFEPDFLEAFLAFLLFAALEAAADFLAFFTTLETAFAGADFAAAFLKRL